MNIEASFVRSAASASDLPRDGLAEIAMIGRSNVGKSSLINALVRRKVARTSAAPGKTRLANVYRVARGNAGPLYLIDLPGYGYASGDRSELDAVVREYFTVRLKPDPASDRERTDRRVRLQADRDPAALLLVDSRHPGLDSDRNAWRWLQQTVERCALVATKIDKLTRGERIRALKQLESVFDTPVLPVSAETGEGLDQLWRTIERLRSNPGATAETAAQPPPRPRR